MSESTADRNPFERLAEEFAERLRRGEHPSLTEYVERYPEHADDIRELFPALALVEQFKPARQDLDGVVRRAGRRPARGDLPEQLGDYRILRYLGEGGMGVVYEAVRESLRSHVALKVMHPQYPQPRRTTCADSAPRPARRPGCTTPTSSASSTTASTTASAITRCSTSPARAWTRSWTTSASSARRKRDRAAGETVTVACQIG